MRPVGIFNGEVVEVKCLLKFHQKVSFRFVQTNPDEGVWLLKHFADVVYFNIGKAQTGLVQNYVFVFILGFAVLVLARLNVHWGDLLRLF